MPPAPLLPTVAVILSLLPVGSCFDLSSPASPGFITFSLGERRL